MVQADYGYSDIGLIMDFIKSLTDLNDLTDEEAFEKLLDDIRLPDNLEDLDEDAMNRVIQRVHNREIALYRYLVGTRNVMLTKRFIELAKDGNSIPSSFVKGYLPAIEMLDEIVQAGPAFVQNLKVLYSRAKKANKS